MDWQVRKREELQEQQERRPPVYNSEDYVQGLKRFCKLTGLQLYLGDGEEEELINGSKITIRTSSVKEDNGEMGLRQFRNISELLAKLKGDLNLSFPSFTKEFVGSSNDGVTLLLEGLKAIQLSQTNITGSLNQLGSRANHVMFKRALNDEFEALVCLKICSRSDEGAQRLAEHPSGLFTIAVCVMSNYSKSRVLSLQLLARLCDSSGGHKQVSDSISMLRLRFGEPVRFKFLVGMLNSYNSSAFQISCLRFLNRFIETSKDSREKILIQTELEEAGFDTGPLKKLIQSNGVSRSDLLKEELNRWAQNYVDVNGLVKKLLDAERANRKLREEIVLLKEKNRQIESEKEELKSNYNRLECELNDNAVLKFEMSEDVKFSNNSPMSYDDDDDEEDDDGRQIARRSSLVTILNSNVVTEDNRTIITCSSSSSDSPKIVPDSGLSSNSSSHGETKSTSEEDEEASPHSPASTPSRKESEVKKLSDEPRINVKKTISKFNREAALRSNRTNEVTKRERVVEEATPGSLCRTPSPPPRCVGDSIQSGNGDSLTVPLTAPLPPTRRRPKSVTPSGRGSKGHKDDNTSKTGHRRSSSAISLSTDGETSDDKEDSYMREKCRAINDNTLETVSARSFGRFVRPPTSDEDHKVKRHKSFFGQKTKTRHGKPKEVMMRRAESFHHGKSSSVERLTDDPFHPNNFQRHFAAAATTSPKKSSLSKSKSMEYLKAKLLSKKPSSIKTKNKTNNNCSLNSNNSFHHHQNIPHSGVWSGVHSFHGGDYVASLNRENSFRNAGYDWRQDTPFWNKRWPSKGGSSNPPPPPPQVPPPPTIEDWIPSSPAFRTNGWMMQNSDSRKYHFPSAFQPSSTPEHVRHSSLHQPASYAFEDPISDIADRLEITELSDEEPEIPSPDYGGNNKGSKSKIEGSYSSIKSGTSTTNNRNILDMPSGLY